ncbi:MAG: ATP-binding cassette domain-containing protein [Bacteroidetes bacterium]|nr:ATP-binding cassette domain-containing protein [Bacteroidota bacterium]
MSIIATHLTKKYGEFEAVKSVSFEIRTGEVVGFLGPNGAGKTTTMKMLTGILKPSAGSATINGADLLSETDRVRQLIGFLPENNPLYTDLTVTEYLAYSAEVTGVPKEKITSRLSDMIDVCGLSAVFRKPIGTLSKGYRQRVGLAQSLIHDPAVLILDEPTTGLDPNQIQEIRDLIRELGKEKTVLLSTHILQEVEAICNRVLIINNGNLVADGTPGELQIRFQGGTSFLLEFLGSLEGFQVKFRSVFPEVPMEVLSVGQEDLPNTIKFTTINDHRFSQRLFRFCADQQIDVLQLYRQDTNLEDIFRQLTVSPN